MRTYKRSARARPWCRNNVRRYPSVSKHPRPHRSRSARELAGCACSSRAAGPMHGGRGHDLLGRVGHQLAQGGGMAPDLRSAEPGRGARTTERACRGCRCRTEMECRGGRRNGVRRNPGNCRTNGGRSNRAGFRQAEDARLLVGVKSGSRCQARISNGWGEHRRARRNPISIGASPKVVNASIPRCPPTNRH